MKPLHLLLFSLSLLLTFSSCKKEAGEGGNSSIKGKVHGQFYDNNLYAWVDSGYVPDVDVYIIYGSEPTFAERQRTNHDGTYEFKYLRSGKYQVYAYSRDSTGFYKFQANRFAAKIAIIENVEITKRKQTVEVLDINTIE